MCPSPIPNFIEILSVVSVIKHEGGQTDRQTHSPVCIHFMRFIQKTHYTFI